MASDSNNDNNTTTSISLLDGGAFNRRDIRSTNVGELRNELEIPTDAQVNVNGEVRLNDFAIEDGAVIAYPSNNKVGG